MAKHLERIPKQLRVVILLTLIVMSFTGMAKAYDGEEIGVRVVVDGESNYYKTTEMTVSDLLNAQNIVLSDLDKVSPDLNTPLEDNMKIVIEKSTKVNIVIEGRGAQKKKTVDTDEVTVGRIVMNLKKETGNDYILEDGISSSTKLEPDMVINLKEIEEEITVETESIPFETQTVKNSELPKGTTKIKSEGTEGKKEIKTKTVYTGGEITSKEVVSTSITKDPVNKIIEEGTAVPKVEEKPQQKNSTEVFGKNSNKQDLNSSRKITMTATAYTASSACTGKNPGDKGYGITASGMKARVGVVAVDTNVIPLGTNLYIEGYGYAVAGDTGGAIKGHKIDLFFDSYSEAIKFGVKRLDVYILD